MEKKSRGETQVMTSSFISPIAQHILPPKEKKKKKNEKWKSQNRFFVIYFADDMLCSFVSNGDSFFLKAITYQFTSTPSVTFTDCGGLLTRGCCCCNNEFFIDVSKTKQKSYTKFNRSETEKTPFQQATT